uniref:Protein kinase domain-containing protein n=1 Tax=Kalanchoe fedtschenkoi TaxID=63787 RepID=A0A7N0V8Q8_KALFE
MAPRIGGFKPEALEIVTDGFCESNCIGRFQFGKVYRGVGEFSDHTVKLFEKVDNYEVQPGDNEGRVQDEDCLTGDDRVLSHPNMVEFLGISYPTERPAVVYKMQALDTVHNLLDKDSFSWLQRVKVVYGFASVVASLHDCRPIPYILRNISAAHIMLDQDYNPKLYDFSMISGGILPDKRELLNQYVRGCHGYIDPDYVCNGKWSEKCDVFAFGVVLLGLISKKVVLDEAKKTNPEPFLYEWAYSEYQMKEQELKFDVCKFSLVHRCLEEEPLFSFQDGVKLTVLAMQCVDFNPLMRPTMKQVVQRLRKLCIIQNNPDLFDLENTPAASSFSISGIGKLLMRKLEVYSKMPRNMPKALFKKLMGNDFSKLIEKELQYLAPIILTYDDLKRITDGFSGENYIDIHQFGKLYHGKIGCRAVTVKTLEATVGTSIIKSGDNENRLNDELVLLQHPRFISHPHIVKLIGYCYEDERLGAVYDLESLDCLVNLIEKDSFSWGCRIDFAIKLAGLIKFLQDSKPPYTSYLLRNLFPNNILVDKGYNPKLFNFGMITGGILNDRERVIYVHGWKYYIDPHTNCYGMSTNRLIVLGDYI